MNMQETALTSLGLIDLTSLNDDDSAATILNLCQQAVTPFGQVAALCIYPQFLPIARNYLAEHQLAIKLATVTNFPSGTGGIAAALAETAMALELGADEIDIVFPYRDLTQGNTQVGAILVEQAKQLCGNKVLKVIIESGELKDPQLIALASNVAIKNGADFIKTSTGKVAVNASLSAAEIMLKAIKQSNCNCGFKAAGGIRKLSEAKAYLELACSIMGDTWLSATKFRFGASGLLTEVLNELSQQPATKFNESLY